MFTSILTGPPYDIRVLDGDNGCKMTIVPVSQDGNRIVSIVCELAQMDSIGFGIWEFSFSVDCFSLDDSTEPFRTQDRTIAAPYIADEARGRIVGLVSDCLKSLINQVKPNKIYRVTKERDPVEAALKKHHILTESLENTGYSICEEGTDPFGRRYWVMEC